SRKLARYEFSKLNLTELITLEQVTEEIRVLQEELGHYLDEYEGLVKKLEMFVKVLNDKDFDKKFSIEILLE
ncbi:TPA: relaxase, partial [Streptococcus suis]|nr:relaxase [Streptococcus suis]